jgi:hypothetical protein
MRRKWIAALLAALTILGLCGCAQKTDTQKTVSMIDLRTAMEEAAPSLPEMRYVSDADDDPAQLFAHLSDMDYDKVERFFLSYSATGLADEIAVIAVKNRSDADAAADSLRAHLEDRARLYGQYKPDQLQRVENGLVFTWKHYAVLIVCDEADAVKAAFDHFVTGYLD